MKIVNLTPHDINVVLENGEVVTYPKSGQIARVAVEAELVQTLENSGVPLLKHRYGAVEGLPPFSNSKKTLYIVSALVKAAADRYDLVSPGAPIRDADGRVIGCKGLVL